MPDMPFRSAALILTHVVDRYPDAGAITTELGCKAISSDFPVEEMAYALDIAGEVVEYYLHTARDRL